MYAQLCVIQNVCLEDSICSGVHKGSSPLLFVLLMNDPDNELKGGVNIGVTIVKRLAFTDDICFMVKCTLQNMINAFQKKYAMNNNYLVAYKTTLPL